MAVWLLGSAGCIDEGRIVRRDASTDVHRDAGSDGDAAAGADGGHGTERDAGPPDAGPPDAGAPDAGAGASDAGSEDAGPPDAGPACVEGDPCDGVCVDLDTDPAHCGTCGTVCAAPANAAPTCEAGACGHACLDGYADCAGGAADGCETDTRANDEHCGRCGNRCGEYETCEAGACVDLPYGMATRPGASPCRLTDPPPTRLSATRCYARLTTRAPAPGLIPYGVNSVLWADGTGKGRYLVVPPGTTIGYRDDGAWSFPVGSILIKEFLLETVEGDPSSEIPLETRFLVRRSDGWDAYTYAWNATQTEAFLDFGGRRDFVVTRADGSTATYTHWFPSRDECVFCHNDAAGVALGPRTVQMNRDFDYGAVTDNQLRTLAHVGLFSAPLPAAPSALPSMPEPSDTSAPLVERARSYLEGNCAHCHRPGGPTPRSMDLRYLTPFGMTNTCNVVPESETFGITDARIVAPGSPSRSVLYHRANRRGWAQMPIVGTLRVDTDGVALLRSWITSLTACP